MKACNGILKFWFYITDISENIGHHSRRKDFNEKFTRRYFIKRRDFLNIRCQFQDQLVIKMMLLQCSALQQEEYNPVMYYKPQHSEDQFIKHFTKRFTIECEHSGSCLIEHRFTVSSIPSSECCCGTSKEFTLLLFINTERQRHSIYKGGRGKVFKAFLQNRYIDTPNISA